MLLFVDHRHRAAHRLREHRQPAARARRESHDGDGRASLARRHAPAAHRAGAHRVGAARRRSAGSRASSSRTGRSPASRRCCRRRSLDAMDFSLSAARARVHGGRSRSPPACCSASCRRCRARGPISSRSCATIPASSPAAAARRASARRSSPRRSRSRWRCSSRPGCSSKSLRNISRVDLGINIDNMVTFAISPARSGYDSTRTLALYARVEEELAAIPGVTRRDVVGSSAARRQQLGRGRVRRGIPEGSGHRRRLALQRRRPELLPRARRSDPRRPRLHARATTPAR